MTQRTGNEFRVGISQASAEDSANRVLVVSSVAEDQVALGQLLASHSYPRYRASSVLKAADWLSKERASCHL